MFTIRKRVFLTAAIAALLALPATLTAQPETRFDMWPAAAHWPESAYQAPPFYAQVSFAPEFGWEIYHDNEWAAIPFLRDPKCVPTDFNLLDMFDVPQVFGCPLRTQGFEIFRPPLPPNNVQGPLKSVYWGLGNVQIYFVRWPKLQTAVAHYRLTINDLNSLVKAGDAAVGTAAYYWEEVHPSGGQAVEPFMEISAYGTLQAPVPSSLRDKRQFYFYVTGGDQTALIKQIKFTFE